MMITRQPSSQDEEGDTLMRRAKTPTIIGACAIALTLSLGCANANGDGTKETPATDAQVQASDANSVAAITSFDLSDGPTDLYEGNVTYLAETDDKTQEVKIGIKQMGESRDKVAMTKVDATFMDKLKALVEKHGAKSWDGFSESDPNVLDGDAFSLSITCADKTSISAHGYMSYPEGFGEFEADVEKLFKETLGQPTE